MLHTCFHVNTAVVVKVDRDSIVGIATSYGDPIPIGAEVFRTLSERPGAHAASCPWVMGLFPGDKAAGAELSPPTPI